MQFSIGDKVVHPHHGPGQITGLEYKELTDKAQSYFVIDIAAQGLTLYIPRRKMDEAGVRMAISQARVARVLDTLRSRPRRLPENFKERQETVWEKIRTGRTMQLAEVVRDLTWLRYRDHLTQKDTEYLKRGRDLLAAEMALASDTQVSEVSETIEAELLTALASPSPWNLHHPAPAQSA
jgi:CarD family transcriptional regulator